jgi:hypothetical protein
MCDLPREALGVGEAPGDRLFARHRAIIGGRPWTRNGCYMAAAIGVVTACLQRSSRSRRPASEEEAIAVGSMRL